MNTSRGSPARRGLVALCPGWLPTVSGSAEYLWGTAWYTVGAQKKETTNGCTSRWFCCHGACGRRVESGQSGVEGLRVAGPWGPPVVRWGLILQLRKASLTQTVPTPEG